RDRRRQRVGRQPAAARQDERHGHDGGGRDDARLPAAVHDDGASPRDRQEDNERLAQQQQQPGEVAGRDELAADPDREDDEQAADRGAREQLREALAPFVRAGRRGRLAYGSAGARGRAGGIQGG